MMLLSCSQALFTLTFTCVVWTATAGEQETQGSCLLQYSARRRPPSVAGIASKRFPNALHALGELDKAYQGHAKDPSYINVDKHKAGLLVEALDEPFEASVYGEILPTSFIQLLDHIGARKGQRYYDLGSGLGKTVMLAALLGFNATGVELVSERWGAACEALLQAKSRGLQRDEATRRDASFQRGSFLDTDFSDADVVFTASVFWTPPMMDSIAKRAELMKPGSKIITAGLYEDMHPYNYGLLGSAFSKPKSFRAPTTWSNTSEWIIYEVKGRRNSASDTSFVGTAERATTGTLSDRCSLQDSEDHTSLRTESEMPEHSTLTFSHNIWNNTIGLIQHEVEITKAGPPTVSKVTYVLLAMAFGCCGCDRCFMGQMLLGCLKGFTFGGFLVWQIIDYFIALTNALSKSEDINVFGYHANFDKSTIETAWYIAIALFICSLIQQVNSSRNLLQQMALQKQQQAALMEAMQGRQAPQQEPGTVNRQESTHCVKTYMPSILTRNLRKAGLVDEKPSIAELIKAFDQLDENKDGTLSYDEIKAAFAATGASDDDVDAMIKSADKDGDGKIDQKEFLIAFGKQ